MKLGWLKYFVFVKIVLKTFIHTFIFDFLIKEFQTDKAICY